MGAFTRVCFSFHKAKEEIQCLRKEDVRQAKKGKGREEGEQEELKRRGLRGSKKKTKHQSDDS